jgi:hypothetical protein
VLLFKVKIEIRHIFFCRGFQILVNLDALFTNGDVGETFVNPRAAIIVVGSLAAFVQGGMRVAGRGRARRPRL